MTSTRRADDGLRRLARGIVILAVATVGCDSRSDAPEPPEPAALGSRVVRLLDSFDGTQVKTSWRYEALREAPATTLADGLPSTFTATFDDDMPESLNVYERLRGFASRLDLLAQDGPVRPTTRRDETRGGVLHFDVASGLVAAVVPVRPDTPYHLTTAARVAAALDAPDDAFVAHAVLYELHQAPPDATGDGWWDAVESSLATSPGRHVWRATPPMSDDDGAPFQDVAMVWRTSVYTNALLILLSAGDPGWWTRGETPRERPDVAVEFGDVQLTELPLRRYLAVQDRSLQDDLPTSIETEQELFVRSVKILGDLRRATLAPPSTTFRLPVTLPSDAATRVDLSFGLLPEPGAHGALEVSARLIDADGRDVGSGVQRTLTAGAAADEGWHDLRLDPDGHRGAATVVVQVDGPESAGVAACAEPRIVTTSTSAERPWNLLLISLDTLRRDALGLYGATLPDGSSPSPHLDAFAERCIVFEDAYTVAPYTLPSHATMMTGQYPRVHGVIQAGFRLIDRHPLLAPQLIDQGYETAAFTGGGFVGYEYGFHLGFDRFGIVDPLLTTEDPLRNDFPRPRDRAGNDRVYARFDLDDVQRWWADRDGHPSFLFLHSFVVHNYHPPASVLEALVTPDLAPWLDARTRLHAIDLDLARAAAPPPAELCTLLERLYLATVQEADRQVGALLTWLDARGDLDRTVIAITSDHGEEFGEHGGLLHGRTLYEEVLRVPWLLWVPGCEAERRAERVDLADLCPTLAGALGLESLERDGDDLWGASRRRPWVWAEVDATNLSTRRAFLEGDLKRIENPDSAREEPGYESRRPPPNEHFTLEPGGERALAEEVLREPMERTARELAAAAFHWLPEDERQLLTTRLSADALAHLQKLGYVVEPPPDLVSPARKQR